MSIESHLRAVNDIFYYIILQAVELRGELDVCIDSFILGSSAIDLFSGTLTTDIQNGCPRHHCLLPTSFTGTAPDSYIEFNETNRAEDLYFIMQFEFQTRYNTLCI